MFRKQLKAPEGGIRLESLASLRPGAWKHQNRPKILTKFLDVTRSFHERAGDQSARP
jgi:hypothetical protein